jgi:hypothetical protein
VSLPAAGRPVAEATDQSDATADLLRRALLALAVLGGIGTALELVLLRHWDNPLELTPFAFLVALGVGFAVLVRRPGRRSVLAARIAGAAVAVSGAIGVFVHVRANYEAAPLDFRFTATWPTTPEPIRWLLAATDTVGPSPTLAPAALTFAALCLLAATLHHPALRPADREVSESPARALRTSEESQRHHRLGPDVDPSLNAGDPR